MLQHLFDSPRFAFSVKCCPSNLHVCYIADYFFHFQGLTDKFKVKDRRYSGSATLLYDEFMSMVIPFLVSYD